MIRFAKVLVSIVATVALVTGCSGGSSSTKSATTTAASTADKREALRAISLRANDLPSGTTLSLIAGGDQVAGQVTLDMCGAEFPSESARVARLQQSARDAGGKPVVTNENVLYRSPRDATEALNEVRTIVGRCPPNEFKSSHVEGIPPLRYQLQVAPDAQLGTLSADHVAVNVVLTARDGRTDSTSAVYQRRGAVLGAVYGPSLGQILPFAHIITGRLAALTPAQAGE